MSVSDMWKACAVQLLLMILLDLALISLGGVAWLVLGALALLAGAYFSFRRGMGFGHEACALLDSVQSVQAHGGPGRDQLDAKLLSRTWSRERGIRGVLAAALIPYAASCLYMAAALVPLKPVLMPARVAALLLAMPYWPVVGYWFESMDQLHPAIIALLMISPFVLPLCMFAGYMQGPKLWQKSERAMAQGRRRAKARSRVGKKRVPKPPKPEI